jgi:hypothetical protein
MWTIGGVEAALLVVAIALIGWLRRNVVVELAEPIRVGPFIVRLRSPEEAPPLVRRRSLLRRRA